MKTTSRLRKIDETPKMLIPKYIHHCFFLSLRDENAPPLRVIACTHLFYAFAGVYDKKQAYTGEPPAGGSFRNANLFDSVWVTLEVDVQLGV